VSLWQWMEHDESLQVGTPEFAVMLGRLHDELAAYDADLPTLVGPLTDISTALTLSSDPVLHRTANRLIPIALEWPRRPLHGDAHLGNVLLTPGGPRWTDFEDVCVGPLEWDLASLTLSAEAVDTYPGQVDRRRLADCQDLRRLQILASLIVGGSDDMTLYGRLVAHLESRWG
jgi:thiamine kinase-like enzyme